MKFSVANKAFKEKMKVLSDFSFNDELGRYVRIETISDEAIQIKTENTVDACEVEIFAKVIDEGVAVLPFVELFSVIASATDAKELVFETTDKVMSIYSSDEEQNFEFQLKLVPLQTDPINWKIENSFNFGAFAFTDMLKTACTFSAINNSRAFICGVRVENIDNSLRMSSTDGKRALRSMLMKYGKDEEDVPMFRSITIPIKFAKRVAKNFAHQKGDLTIGIGNNCMSVSGEKTKMYSSLIREDFPNINKFFGFKFKDSLTVNSNALFKSITRAASCKDKMNNVCLELDTNMVTVSSQNDTKNVVDTVDCHYTGKKQSIRFSFDYMLDLLNTFSTEMITIQLNAVDQPIIAEDNKATYVIMPIVQR